MTNDRISHPPHARQQSPPAAVRVRMPGVPVLAVCVPMHPVRGVGVSARRVSGGPPEGEERSGHRISERSLHSSRCRFYPLIR